jgi:hypothetical protein
MENPMCHLLGMMDLSNNQHENNLIKSAVIEPKIRWKIWHPTQASLENSIWMLVFKQNENN